MQGQTHTGQRYVLGNHAEELARLDHQAAVIERPTRLLLQAAGLAAGMRVLDLGTGLGHVARLAGELVGPTGSVLGIDQSADVLAVARERTQQEGMVQVTFAEGNALEWRAPAPFDAIVGRLLLFHVPDPVAAVRHHRQNLRPGGLFVAVDFDLGGSRADPPVVIVNTVGRWVHDAFRAAGAWPRVGARLGTILEEAQLTRVTTFGVQAYLSPRDSSGPRLLAGVVRSLAPTIVAHGLATGDELDLTTLEQRIAEAVRGAGAVILPPTVVGAWGHVPE
jgi:ubiquinone/menaquinone biosynthesis C-methylase UbiE